MAPRPAGERKLPYKPRLSAEARKAAIEESAARLFAERGYDAVTTDDLVEAAEISRPTFYAHFAGKREVYRRVVAKHSQHMVDYMRGRVRTSSGSPGEQLVEVTEAFFAFVEEHPFAWRMLFREPPNDPELLCGAQRIHDQARANVAELLRRVGSADRPLDERTLLIRAEALKSAQQGLAAWWYDHPEVPRSELVATIAAMSEVASSAPG